jgi:hypothetical protein
LFQHEILSTELQNTMKEPNRKQAQKPKVSSAQIEQELKKLEQEQQKARKESLILVAR